MNTDKEAFKVATRVHLVRQTGPIGVYESRCAFGTEVSHANFGKWTMINNGMYIVEILRGGEDLLYEMDEMNRWMDQHVRAPKIQFYWVAEILVFRVTFNTVTGATAFARAFEGRLLDPGTPEPDAFAPRNRVDKWTA